MSLSVPLAFSYSLKGPRLGGAFCWPGELGERRLCQVGQDGFGVGSGLTGWPRLVRLRAGEPRCGQRLQSVAGLVEGVAFGDVRLVSTSPNASTGVTQASESANTLAQRSRSLLANACVSVARNSGDAVRSFCSGRSWDRARGRPASRRRTATRSRPPTRNGRRRIRSGVVDGAPV